jgi:hypothetical protein
LSDSDDFNDESSLSASEEDDYETLEAEDDFQLSEEEGLEQKDANLELPQVVSRRPAVRKSKRIAKRLANSG